MPIIKSKKRASINMNVSRAQLQNPAFAGESERAIQRVGGAIQRSANQVFDSMQRIERADAETRFNERRNGKNGILAEYNAFQLKNATEDIRGYQKRTADWLEKRRAQELEAAGDNKFLQERIDKEFNSWGVIEREKARVHETTETLKQSRYRNDQTNQLLVNEVMATGDQVRFRQRLAEAESNIRKQVGVLYNDAEAEKRITKLRDNMAKAFVHGASNKGNYSQARQLVKQNPNNVFGSDVSKQQVLDQFDEIEEKALDREYRNERKEEIRIEREKKKIRESAFSSMMTLDLSDPEQAKQYDDTLEKLQSTGIITASQYRVYSNYAARKNKENIEQDIIGLYNEGKVDEARAALIAYKDTDDANEKTYKTLYNTIHPKSSTKMSLADKQLRKDFLNAAKERDDKIDMIRSYEEFTKSKSVEESVLMAKVKHGVLSEKPSNTWTRLTKDDEEKPEYNLNSVRELKMKAAKDLLTAKNNSDRKAEREAARNIRMLKREEQKLEDYDRASQLLKDYKGNK